MVSVGPWSSSAGKRSGDVRLKGEIDGVESVDGSRYGAHHAVDEILTNPAYRRRARALQRQYTAHNGPQAAARLTALCTVMIRHPTCRRRRLIAPGDAVQAGPHGVFRAVATTSRSAPFAACIAGGEEVEQVGHPLQATALVGGADGAVFVAEMPTVRPDGSAWRS